MAKTKEQSPIYEQHSFDGQGNWQTPRRLYTQADVERLREALEPFVDVYKLRRLAIEGKAVHEALRTDKPPREVQGLLATLAVLLKPHEREQIKGPIDAAAYFMVLLGEAKQEELHTMLLDTKNRVMGTQLIYRGTIDSAMVRVAEVYRKAIEENAAAIIVCHSHPSGSVEPSPEDLMTTLDILRAGQLLAIPLLDHIIVGKGTWYSLKEKGKIPLIKEDSENKQSP